MHAAEIATSGALVLSVLGMMLVIGGVLVAGLFMPGVLLIGIGLVGFGVAGVLRARGASE